MIKISSLMNPIRIAPHDLSVCMRLDMLHSNISNGFLGPRTAKKHDLHQFVLQNFGLNFRMMYIDMYNNI